MKKIMKKLISILLVAVLLIGGSQNLVISASAASYSSISQTETKGWLTSFWEWLFPPKDEKNTVENDAPTIVGTPAQISEYDAYRLEVEKLNNNALKNTEQLHRLDKNYKKIAGTGMCNLCSLETLLNRRVAYDFGDYSNPFDDYDMFQAVGVRDLGNGLHEYAKGKHGYYLSGRVGEAQKDDKIYKYSNTVTYKPVLLGNTEVTKRINETGMTGLDAQYEAISALLREHPEGIWLRAEYGKHAIVVTDYVMENGRIQLYAIDPVDVRDNGFGREPIENLYFYRNNYKDGIISDISQGKYRINIAYLEQVGGSTATHPQDDRTPALSVTGQSTPETLREGSNFGLRGTIKTDCGVITSVYGEITDLSGNVVQSGQHYPNKMSDNLRYSINNDLSFGSLSVGSYVYRVRATAKNGAEETTQTLIECQFQVQGESPAPTTPAPTEPAADQKPTVWLSDEKLPADMQQGSNFGLRGIVSTDYGVITHLYGGLIDAAGNEVQSGHYYPDTSSVDLRYTINNDLKFGNLPSGEYTYRVDATAQNGNEQTSQNLIWHSFQVYAPSAAEPTPPIPEPDQPLPPAPIVTVGAPVLSISGHNLPGSQKVGQNFGIRGTVSTDCGTITELYGAIWDSSGNVVCSGWYNPYSTTVDLRTTINNDLVFGTLGAGNYTYYVQAKAEGNGQQTVETLIEHAFTVGAASESQQSEPALNFVGYNMTVNVGKGSTLRFCSTVSTADQYEIGSLPNGATVYVYGTTQQQYEGRTWAKISYNGTDGWVNYKWLS